MRFSPILLIAILVLTAAAACQRTAPVPPATLAGAAGAPAGEPVRAAPAQEPVPASPARAIEVILRPESLGFSGGKVILEVRLPEARLDGALRQVLVAPVAVIDASGQQVATATAERAGDSWRAEVELPPNIRADGQAQTYTIRAWMVDGEGRRVEGEGEARVLAPEPPPPLSPPFTNTTG